jgi:RNA-directed DNA polymerase
VKLHSPRTGSSYIGYRPSKRSIRRAVDKVHALTARNMTWQETTDVVVKLNRVLRGWANYFQVGTVSGAYRALELHGDAVAPMATVQAQGMAQPSGSLLRLVPVW